MGHQLPLFVHIDFLKVISELDFQPCVHFSLNMWNLVIRRWLQHFWLKTTFVNLREKVVFESNYCLIYNPPAAGERNKVVEESVCTYIRI